MGIDRCFNVEDFGRLARKKIPSAIYDYLDGGSDDEVTLDRNKEAFRDYHLIPNVLVNVENIDLKTSVLGVDMELPFYLGPTGGSKLFHHEKEAAVAKAAAKEGVMYGLSTFSTTSIEDVAEVSSGPKMFQLYILKDRELSREFITRAKAAKYDALCLTVDSSIAGNRERDLASGLNFPPKITPTTIVDFLMHPAWLFGFQFRSKFTLANIDHKLDALGSGMNVFELAHHLMDVTVTWDDVEWLAKEWGGPFAVKGLQCAEDVKKAISSGATAAVISSHGGRQLDGSRAPIDSIRPIRDAVGNDIELILDSGIRRGTDMIKALALGADACSFGRPYIYALAAGGEAGVRRMISLLREELIRDMGLLGVTDISQIAEKHITHRLAAVAPFLK